MIRTNNNPMKFRYNFIVIVVLSFSSCYNFSFAQTEGDIGHSDVLLDSLTLGRDSVKNYKSTFNGYPYAFYTPETELAFGAGGIFVFYTSKDSIVYPSKIGFGGFYSTLGNYKISANPAFYFFENNLYIRAPISFGFFVDKFWGVGDDTPETGNEQYTRQDFSVTLYLQSPPIVFSADRSGLVIDYNNTEIIDKRENPLLYDSTLIGADGGSILGFGFDLTWENRDNIFFPNKGGYQYFRFSIYPSGVSDFYFIDIELDVRKYWSFSKDHVFATNFYIKSVSGDVPFYKLPAIGGSQMMRGYFYGRYRDNFYSMLQVEYRQYFWRRFGFVVFGGLGNVSSQLLSYDFSTMKYSYGAGLRFLFNKEQKINLRMDIGFGQDGNRGIYFGIEEAF